MNLSEFWKGVGLVTALHVVQLVVFFTSGKGGAIPDAAIVLFGFGIIQLVYVIPLAIIFKKDRRKGILAMAGLTFAANVITAGGHIVP